VEAEPEQFVTVSGGIALATEAGTTAAATVAVPTTRLATMSRSPTRNALPDAPDALMVTPLLRDPSA